METKVISPHGKEVVIGENLPTVVIGERINPFGKGPIKEGMISGNMDPIREEAVRQVEAGADILVISVGAFGIDETDVLPRATEAVMGAVDAPLCLESRNPVALDKALQLKCGRPIISSVTGEEQVLQQLLPLAKEYDTALVALASDESGIPNNAARRHEIITHIVEKAQEAGIAPETLIADCIAESSAVNNNATLITLETMNLVRKTLGLNLVLGASNVSFGLPNRMVINSVFLALAIHGGLNSAIVNAEKMKPYIMATDLLLGRDNRARRYTTYYRKQRSAAAR
ncbi:MAG: 5-methyltetrahydrofolate:corrinoid/iron-sulfur protein co-methyltransferase [Syntrophorhabdaceae bacterium PtaU1.Bin034]|nr:MAG: 5-methyltetrahydrofolate:corrinoid/iron-sulfur protein co-methyltransferase [Syntrophorhabdaceae bacterium PtaU1.Bin034]